MTVDLFTFFCLGITVRRIVGSERIRVTRKSKKASPKKNASVRLCGGNFHKIWLLNGEFPEDE